MSTYAQEAAAKRAAKLKTARRYRFVATGYDLLDRRAHTPADGTLVVKTQPYGVPKNGTMGHVYIADATTGEFLGLVDKRSLEAL